MANPDISKKSAEEAALSAVEEALKKNLQDISGKQASVLSADQRSPKNNEALTRELEQTIERAVNDLKTSEARLAEEANARKANPILSSGPANDDKASIGALVYALQKRPKKTPFWGAALGSVIWAGVVAYGSFSYLSTTVDGFGLAAGQPTPALGIAAAMLFMPIMLFFVCAAMIWRSQDMNMTARSLGEVALRLAEPESVAKDALLSVSQAVRREVVAMGDGVERAIARAGELEALVHSEVSALERSYSENELRIRSLVEQLVSEREAIIGNATRVRESIDQAQVNVDEKLSFAATNIAELIGRVSEELGDKLDERQSDLIARVTQAGEGLQSILLETNDSISSSLTMNAQQLAKQAEQLTGQFNQIGEAINSNLQNTSQNIAQTLDNSSSLMSQRGSELIEQLTTSGQAINDRIASTGGEITSSMLENGDKIASAIETGGQQIDLRLRDTATGVQETLLQSSQAMVNRLTGVTDQITSSFEAKTSEFENSLFTRASEANSMIEGKLGELLGAISDRGGALSTNLDERISTLSNIIVDQGGTLQTALTTAQTQLEISLMTQTDLIGNVMEERTRGFVGEIENTSLNFAEKLSQSATDLTKALTTRGTKLNDILSATADRLAETVTNRGEVLTQALALQTEKLDSQLITINESLNERVPMLTEAMAQRSHELADAMTKQREEVDRSLTLQSELINQQSNHIQGLLSTQAEGIGSIMDERTRALEDAISARLSEVDNALGNRAEAIAANIQVHSDAITAHWQDTVVQAQGSLEKEIINIGTVLDERSRDISERLANRIRQIDTLLTERGTDLSNNIITQITERSEQAVDNLHQAGAEVSKVMEDNLRRTLDDVRITNRALTDNVESILARLGESNDTLRGLLDNTSGNLNQVQTRLGNQVSALMQALSAIETGTANSGDAIAKQIGDMREISSSVFSDVARLTEQFESQSRGLRETMEVVESRGLSMDRVLAERQDQLTSVMALLQERSNDVEALMQNFSSRLERNVYTAESRLKELSEGLSVNADAATSSILAEFDQIRRMTGDEGSRLGEMVRENYDRIMTEMSQMMRGANIQFAEVIEEFQKLRDTTGGESDRLAQLVRQNYQSVSQDIASSIKNAAEQFNEVAAELRHVGSDITRELVTTRDEVRRELSDLPEETRRSAESVRKTITDQVNALNELSEIISRHASSGDVSVPVRDETTPRQRREQEPASRSRVQEVREEPRRPAPTDFARDTARPTAAPAPSPARSYARDARDERSNQKLSMPEILARASREEPRYDDVAVADAPQGDRIEALERIYAYAIDIVRAVDDNIPQSAWDAYGRGEHDVFVRRLRSIEGQRTSDRIVRSYRTDSEVRRSVDDYISEFRRFIAGISRNDRDNMLTRAYLTSDAGRVYQMLNDLVNPNANRA